MSAIAGIYYLDERKIDSQFLLAMENMLAHRGQDDSGVWQNDSVGLVHRMLWTTPESLKEKLPLLSDDQKFAITADARIDNRDELIDLLKLDDTPTENVADSQLILAAYQKWGEACVERLIGAFAFAIWDEQQQHLFCARDHFGIKPFCYYHSERNFVFSSEIKGLFCVPEVPRQLNEIRIANFLTATFKDKEITIYKNIFRLSPAHTLKISIRGAEINQYWSLDPTYELKLDSDEEYTARFREIFTEAVRCRLRSAYPVGSMLSGGLDSSSITCVARQILQKDGRADLRTFSAVFDKTPESDERFYINTVIARGGIKPNFFHGNTVGPLVDIEKIIWHQDEPNFAGNLYINWKIYELANSLGVRIILDGFDGDTTVSHGVGYMRELAKSGRWLMLATEVRGYCRSFNAPFVPKFWSYYHDYGLKPWMSKYKITRYIYWRCKQIIERGSLILAKSTPKTSLLSLLNPACWERLEYKKYRQELNQKYFAKINNERERHFHTIDAGSIPSTLELLDRSTAAFSTEIRYPFWDKRLVEFCLSLPANQKMRKGWTRMILRCGMENILPREIQWRADKGNLSKAFGYGIKTFERGLITKIILDKPDYIENYVNITVLEKSYQRLMSSSHNAIDIMNLLLAANLYIWLKNNTDIRSIGSTGIF